MDELLYRNRKPRDEGTSGLGLFESPAHAPAQPVATSEAAAVEISRDLPERRRAVFVAICRWTELCRSGPTDNELIDHFREQGWSANTPRARRVELVRSGLVIEDEERNGSLTWVPSRQGWELYLDLVHGRP